MESILLNPNTGEVLSGGIFRTYEEIETSKQYFKKQQEKEYTEKMIDEYYKSYGNFTWFLYNVNTVLDLGINPDELTKLIFISTYMNYENKLMFNKHTPMTKKNMNQLLNLSVRKYTDFYSSMINNKIFVEKGSAIFLNNNLFAKGEIKQTHDKFSKIRLYAYGIRTIYQSAKNTEHKSLSYIFQAIPFINKDYNIICKNPLEHEIENIDKMNMTDFCKAIGYYDSNITRLKSTLKKVKVNGSAVFNFVDNSNGISMFINPCVYYAGDMWDKVKVLGAF